MRSHHYLRGVAASNRPHPLHADSSPRTIRARALSARGRGDFGFAEWPRSRVVLEVASGLKAMPLDSSNPTVHPHSSTHKENIIVVDPCSGELGCRTKMGRWDSELLQNTRGG
ncbi:hypothetical protein EVAR_62139_1 [Eumeta japonica]|uniref:Uncharacterized protein n=1 Tax=Eumeta variegata TaxID=151549 RepID=A0A4C1ZFY6_EUMVA|nr:hypothetical protein EVAR_62139_1 [Eumeta japonica]